MKLNFLTTSIVVLVAGFAFSCGGGEKAAESNTEETASVEAAPVEVSLEDKYKDDPVYIKGLEKVKGSDCTGCHQIERKLIGPAYADVAAKYENTEANVAMLAQKVIAGGVGVWGEIPMAAHPNLTEEDASDMVRYILLLRK